METGFSPSAIAITGFGAITPAGENACQSFVSYRAGIVAIAEHFYITCTPEEPEWDLPLPLFAAPVPTLEPTQQGVERFVQLAIPAVEEALAQSQLQRSSLPHTALLLALPQPHSSTSHLELQQTLAQQLCNRMGLVGLNQVQACGSAHTGTAEVIDQAARLLQQGKAQHVIILAVDSYLLEERVAFYDEQWRIKSERNVDGFTPGEAACAIVVELASKATERQAGIHGCIHGCAFGHEPHNRNGDKSSTGEGLRLAMEGAIKGHENRNFVHFYSDFNGESYYAYEQGLLQPRFPRVFEGLSMFYPATCFGDTGAASGALAIMLACLEGAKDESHKGFHLITSASDDGKRAALTLETV